MAIQVFGGLGLLKSAGLEHIFRVARNLRIPGGTVEIQRREIARSVCSRAKSGPPDRVPERSRDRSRTRPSTDPARRAGRDARSPLPLSLRTHAYGGGSHPDDGFSGPGRPVWLLLSSGTRTNTEYGARAFPYGRLWDPSFPRACLEALGHGVPCAPGDTFSFLAPRRVERGSDGAFYVVGGYRESLEPAPAGYSALDGWTDEASGYRFEVFPLPAARRRFSASGREALPTLQAAR